MKHTGLCDKEEVKEFRVWIDYLRGQFSWEELARLTKLELTRGKGYASSARVLQDSYKKRPTKEVYNAVRTLYNQMKREEGKMPRVGKPQLDKIVEWVRLYPGSTPADVIRTLNGVGKVAVDMAIDQHLIIKRGTGLWLPEKLPNHGISLNGNAKTIVETTKEEAPVVMAPAQESSKPNFIITWAEIEADIQAVTDKIEVFRKQQLTMFQGPQSLRDLITSEYDRRINKVLETLKSEFI